MSLLPVIIPKKEVSKKFRNSRRPNKDRIGDIITTHEELNKLLDTKHSVVINNHTIIPVACLINYPYIIVNKYLKNNSIRKYHKNITKFINCK